MHKPRSRLVLTALALVVASSGVLYPIHGKSIALNDEVDRIDSELARDVGVHDQLMAAHEKMLAVKKSVEERAFSLCPNTPEAEHEFENTVLDLVEQSGLNSVRMDRRAVQREGDRPSLAIEIVVDGDAYQLQGFLLALEDMRWVTRVLGVSVQPGDDVRRTNIQVAVMMEQKA